MSIHGVHKKKLVLLLMLVFIVPFQLTAITKAHAALSEPNLALNSSASHTGFPNPTASYTCNCPDSPWFILNGIYSYTESPRDRWTNYGSPNASDWLAIDFGTATMFNQIKLYVFNDGGGVQPPASYRIQYWNGASWVDVTNLMKTPVTPAATLNTADFDTVAATKLQVVFTNKGGGAYSGLVELEVFLHNSGANEAAAAAVITAIEQLPLQTAVNLSDKVAIAAARTAYNNLTPAQQNLVSNLYKLTGAEATIATLEAASFTDVSVLSAFSNAAGNMVTLKLSTVVDVTYGMQADRFQINAIGAQVAVTNAVYDLADPSGHTIKLMLSSPALINATSVALSMESGALRTGDHKFNRAVPSTPVITFKNLDLTQNQWIGLDDLVRIIVNPALHIDVDHNGTFDREDIRGLFGQILPRFTWK